MTAAGARPWLAAGALSLLLAAAGGPATAAAVDSPRLEQVTCQGLRVRQRGLPTQRLLVVEVTNPETGRLFARQKVLSTETGTIDARVTASFDGARQLAVEVEAERRDGEVEFAEAIHDFDRPCPAAPASSPTPRRTAAVTAVAVAAVVLVGAGWAVRMARPGRG